MTPFDQLARITPTPGEAVILSEVYARAGSLATIKDNPGAMDERLWKPFIQKANHYVQLDFPNLDLTEAIEALSRELSAYANLSHSLVIQYFRALHKWAEEQRS